MHDKSKSKNNSKDNPYTNNKVKPETDCLVGRVDMETDRVASDKTTINIHNEFSDMFTGIKCFKGTFSLKVIDDTKPH